MLRTSHNFKPTAIYSSLSPNEDYPIVVALHGGALDIIVTEVLVLTLRKANVDHASNEIALNSVLENP